MHKYTRTGNIIFWTGIVIFVIGAAMHENITGAPEPYTSFARPVMIAGVVVVFLTNFFRKKREDSKR
ncbi:hypothetical protein SAMN05421676_10766 [Salinibacillus kushneri]|uniref:Uncharacterized protein n=1 Tax=Salinibacillus kushneri TaxID=237682 RepID=A0A1I0GLX7_9BACI|nr:hypothetical protein [Salinibacillus kushneri]SET71970.1 hypothetical protein SAMN05421676_10766 [Salinibacillus kushneri]